MIVLAVLEATVEMRRHPLRTLLTLSGVIIAISTVVGVGSMLGSAQRLIGRVLSETAGLRNITITYREQRRQKGRWVQARLPNPLSLGDSAAVRESLGQQVERTSLQATLSAVMTRSGAIARDARVLAVEPEYFEMFNRRLLAGRLLGAADVNGANLVAVIGEHAAKAFFGGDEVAGAEVRLNDTRVLAVGVVSDGMLGEGEAIDVFLPISAARFRFPTPSGRTAPTFLHVQTAEDVDVESFKTTVLATILDRHPEYGREDFDILTAERDRRQAEDAMVLIALLFSVIAGLCLLTGGVGIMNVLLAAVVERTRDIGIRRALGARARDIFRQVLVESLCLTGLGGLFGIGLGYLLGHALAGILNLVMKLGEDTPFRLTPALDSRILVLAVVTSLSVGVFFGLYPAIRASRMEPAEALRVE